MPRYFDDASLRFLQQLARNNERAWFHAHKPAYEAQVRDPFLRLLADLQPAVAAISGHLRCEARNVGGALLRIHRDTRFANDKTPYKTWQGARITHECHRQVPAPQVYLHLQPGGGFIGAGLWRPEAPVLRQLRQFVVDNPGGWERVTTLPTFARRFDLDDSEALVRMPRGYPADHPHAQALRRRNWVALHAYDDATMTGPRLRAVIEADLARLAPFLDYLCAALDLEF